MITTSFDPEADAFYVRLSPKGTKIAETHDVDSRVLLDIDETSRVIGLEILNVRSRDIANAAAA
jgi:uncharacterized protein YuzE